MGHSLGPLAQSIERERHVVDRLHVKVIHIIQLHLKDIQCGTLDGTGVRIRSRNHDLQSEREQKNGCDGDEMTDCAHDGASFRDIALHCLLVRCSENVIDPDQISVN
jgi:hypothetical protein